MKLLILSDCHANVDALRAVWEKESDSDYILFAGDMVDYGFFPKETVHWFMEHKDRLFAVKGNHDHWVLDNRNTAQYENEWKNFQSYTFSQLGEEEYAFLESIPHEITFTLDDTDFYMCHTPDELTDEVFYVEQQLNTMQMCGFFQERFQTKFPHSQNQKRVIVYGHSHLQWTAAVGDHRWICNPGSLSYRFGTYEPIRCADYLVLQDGNFSLRHVDFDTTHLYEMGNRLQNQDAKQLAHAFYRL